MTTALLSILMPVRNTAPFLEACLDSILQQSHSAWELIAVNDHSTDNSWAILAAYAQQHPNIKVFNNEGNGIIHALRTAYAHASGQLITRMDSDDLMPPSKLATLATKLLAAGKGHLATGSVKYFSEQTLGNGYLNYEKWLNNLSSTGSNFDELYKECVIPSPCWMLFREDLDACQAFEPNRYPEDYDLVFRFYENNLRIIPCSDILHLWRDSPGRTSRHDPNYADNNFLDIKIHYFLRLNHQTERPLVLWGAGKKGKYIAKILKEKEQPFYWLCNNEKKIGKHIYEVELYPTSDLYQLSNPQIIVAVAQPQGQTEIKALFNKLKMKSMEDYFFFC